MLKVNLHLGKHHPPREVLEDTWYTGEETLDVLLGFILFALTRCTRACGWGGVEG